MHKMGVYTLFLYKVSFCKPIQEDSLFQIIKYDTSFPYSIIQLQN
uniref:Uncharacterized protein n=1 Tax=Anguilla anguilla TaxID=7936 RepID=A0A0E9WPJ1_ANGAN